MLFYRKEWFYKGGCNYTPPWGISEKNNVGIRRVNRPYLTESNKMHPKKLWPKLIFGTVIKPIEFSNISQNQPYLSDRGVQNTPLKIAKNAKKLNMNVLVSRGIEPTPVLTEHSALDHSAIPADGVCQWKNIDFKLV